MPRFVGEFLRSLQARPLPALGLGFLALIFTLPAAVLVALTIIGMPLAVSLVIGSLGGIFIGWLLLAVAVGSILVGLVRPGRLWQPGWLLLLGLLVLYVGTRIPFLGGLIALVGAALGLGALLITLYQTWRRTADAAAPAPSV
jgi:hypothetical protein